MLQKCIAHIKMKKLFHSWFKWCNRDPLIIFLVCFAFGMEGSHGTVGIPGCCRSGFQMGVLRLNLGYKKFGDNIYEGREGGRGSRSGQRSTTISRGRTRRASANPAELCQESGPSGIPCWAQMAGSLHSCLARPQAGAAPAGA